MEYLVTGIVSSHALLQWEIDYTLGHASLGAPCAVLEARASLHDCKAPHTAKQPVERLGRLELPGCLAKATGPHRTATVEAVSLQSGSHTCSPWVMSIVQCACIQTMLILHGCHGQQHLAQPAVRQIAEYGSLESGQAVQCRSGHTTSLARDVSANLPPSSPPASRGAASVQPMLDAICSH